MSDKYLFDKRKRKRKFLKILILFLLGFFPTIIFNILVARHIKYNWLVIFLDCVILLAIIMPFGRLIDKYYAKKDEAIDRKVKARKEMEERKKLILENSYKKIREEKKQKKAVKEDLSEGNNKESR